MSVRIPDTPFALAGKTTAIKYRLRVQGNLVEVKKKIANALTPSDAGRGTVTTFSKGSRLRMLKTIAKIDWGRVPYGVFITLTYPDTEWERDYSQRTIDRSRFVRDLEKYMCREFPILWRIEWKRRLSGSRKGQYAPHLHLMCLGVRFVANDVVLHCWRGVLDVIGHLHTDVRGVIGAEGCGKYLAKYLSKSSSLGNAAYLNRPYMAGRHWGITRPSLVPWADVEHDREISEAVYHEAVAAYIAMATHPGAATQQSFTLLGEQRKGLFLKNLPYEACGPYLDRL